MVSVSDKYPLAMAAWAIDLQHEFLNHSEPGAWLKSQGLTCGYTIGHDQQWLGYTVTLFTEMTDEQWTEYRLRWQ